MALVAVWLTALVPTVSRSMPAAPAFPDLGAWCEASPGDHHRSMSAHDMDAMQDGAACGYCTLFAQTPALGGSFFVAHVLPVPGTPAPARPSRPATGSIARYHAPPRGPPAAAYA